MPDQKESLFEEELPQEEISRRISGTNADRLSIAYSGPALTEGRMDAILLADGLKGFARCVNRIAEMQLGSPGEFRVEVEGEPQAGSLELVLRLFHPVADGIRQIGRSDLLVGIGLILSISGFTVKDVGKTLIAFFKKLRGRPIANETDLKDLFPRLTDGPRRIRENLQ